jgi:hypothetical protein
MTLVKRRAFQQIAGDFGHATVLDAGLLLLLASVWHVHDLPTFGW